MYHGVMDRNLVIAELRAHEAELRAAGIASASLFGSVARGEAGPESDVDIVVPLKEDFAEGGFEYFGRLEDLREHLSTMLGPKVDLVAEPVRKPRLRQDIEEDRIIAF